jgi:hypothetical protein
MSSDNPASAVRALPARPNLEHLKNEAKQRLKVLQPTSPASQLADAQLLVARDYGFVSWRALKAEVDRLAMGAQAGGADSRLDAFVGFYRYGPTMRRAVITVTRDGERLSIQTTGAPRFTHVEEAPGLFVFPATESRYSFERDGDGAVGALVITTDRGEARLTRTDAADAEAAQAAYVIALEDQKTPRAEVPIKGDLERFVGFYSGQLGPSIEITRQDARLFIRVAGQRAIEIVPESETKFFSQLVPAQMSFVVEGDRASLLVLHQSGFDQYLPRVTAEEAARISAPVEKKAESQTRPRTVVKVDPETLKRFAGWFMSSVGPRLKVQAEGERLFVQVDGQDRFEVFPESDLQFFWTVVAAQITFVIDEQGRVETAILHQAGRDLPLARIEGPEMAPGEAA